MMESNSRLTLNLQYPNIAQVAYAMQGDRLSRAVVADLIDGSTPWAPPAGAYGLITASKPDGTFAVYDTLEDGSPAIVIDGSTVTFYLAEQVLADAGAVKMSVAFFTSAGARLTTFRWTEVVAPEAVLDRVVSGNYISVFTATMDQIADAIDEAQTILDAIKAAYGAPLTANTAAAMTDTSRVYVYTGTTTDTLTNGHWYYWDGSAWADGGIYNSTAFETDPTLTIAGAAADAKATGDAVNDLNRHLSDVKSDFDSLGVIEHRSINLADPSKLESGKLLKDGTISESTSKHTDYIDVTKINKIYFYYGNNAVPFNYTNICAYDSEKGVLPNDGIDDNVSQVTYTVPSGVAYIRATIQSAYIAKFMITANSATGYEAYFDPYTEYTKDIITDETKSQINGNTANIEAIESAIGLSKVWELHNEAANISDGDTLRITPVPHTATNVTYSFDADISTFDKITFGRDPAKSYATYIELTDTKVSFCVNVFGSISKSTYDHNLTIANHVSVIITVGDKRSETKIRITTASGVYEATINFNGNNGDVYLASTGTTLTNVSIRMASARWFDSHVLYWDSYESFVGNYMTDFGACLLYDAYPGRTVAGGKNSFDKMMTIYKPSVVIWGLGMNNGDSSSAINLDWLTVAQYIKNVCAKNNITLIFLTIPNTPIVRNTYKNTWIKSTSECPYIDVADAVGANEVNATWYIAPDLASDSQTLTINHTGGYSGAITSVEFDGGTVEVNALKGKTIVINGVYVVVTSNTSSQINFASTDFGTIQDDTLIYPVKLLANDNVHPTPQGSKVIAAKICASLPEIIK